MTEQVMVEQTPADVVSLSQEQVDKFFETGGQDLTTDDSKVSNLEPSEPQVTTVTEAETKGQDAPEDISHQEEEKHARNYQAAMKEERARRQELQRQLEENKQQVARMEAAFQEIIRKNQQASQPQVPAYEEDPLGHLAHTQKELADYVIKQNQYLQAQEQAKMQQAQRQQAENKFFNDYYSAAVEYSKSTPDFKSAYDYLVESRLVEYKTLGYDDSTANQLLREDEAAIVAKAFQDGVNPAERIYATAKYRGYAKPTEVPNNQAKLEAEKQLEKIQKDIQANKTISSTPGRAAPTRQPTLSELSNLPMDEFNELISDEKQWARLMGAG